MELVINRTHRNKVSVDGHLRCNNERICDTAENGTRSLPPGNYPVTLVKCKQYGRRCMCVGEPDCAHCPPLNPAFVFPNTLMPRFCPMLKMGNGVVGRADGSILLGQRVGEPDQPAWGSLIHTKAAYDRVFDAVRKNLERGHEVSLRII